MAEVNQGILWRLVFSSLELSWKSTTHWDVKLPDRVPPAPALHGRGDHALDEAVRAAKSRSNHRTNPFGALAQSSTYSIQRDTACRVRPCDTTFGRALSSADERRTWASWVNRRTNRGQRTRRDSRTDCPVWKTSPKSRSSGATNE